MRGKLHSRECIEKVAKIVVLEVDGNGGTRGVLRTGLIPHYYMLTVLGPVERTSASQSAPLSK